MKKMEREKEDVRKEDKFKYCERKKKEDPSMNFAKVVTNISFALRIRYAN